MPNAGSSVKYKFGTKSEYENLLSIDPNTLYFLIDTNEIYLDGEPYGGGGAGEVDWHEIVEGNNLRLFISPDEPAPPPP